LSGIAGVIFAGGRGERLGHVLKANIVLGGRTLLARVAARLSEVEPLLIAHGPHDPARLDLDRHWIGVPDLESGYAGPLAALAAAVEWMAAAPSSPDLLVTAAVDSPFLPADYVERLVSALPSAMPGATVRSRGQDFPTHGIWRIDSIGELPASLAAGTAPHSLRRFCDAVGAAVIDWPGHAGSDPFFGINTPAELSAAERRLAEGLD
jgi:molybdopterin-guanine dinucleotide biosynthesis protein A